MRATDISRGLVPLAIVTLTSIAAFSAVGVGSRGLASIEPSPVEPGSATAPGPSASVAATLSPEPTETLDPASTPEPTALPAPPVEPAPDDDLALAGHGGVPGRLYCSNMGPFDFAALDNPTGAEDGIGPEYEILRSTLPRFWLPTEYGPIPRVREILRNDAGVSFLADIQSPGPWEHGPYIYVDVRHDGETWSWGGTGDCEPRAWGPAGYGAATWVLDPAFPAPSSTARTLHLLVSEVTCSSGRPAHGRIGPAYVTIDQYDVRIELLVRYLPGDQDCQGVAPTPARLRLPEPLGDRGLRDMNAHLLTGTGG
jgi:hypothetical protein